MTDAELKKLKDDLWHSADVLRSGAHLAANKYGQPILGLIFLRYADILYKQHKAEIQEEYEKNKGKRTEKTLKQIAIEKCGFYLPECAYYDFINDAPDDAPKEYFGAILEQCQTKNVKIGNITEEEELYKNLAENAIPSAVVNMTVDDYEGFLIERRKLMAKMIETYYKSL